MYIRDEQEQAEHNAAIAAYAELQAKRAEQFRQLFATMTFEVNEINLDKDGYDNFGSYYGLDKPLYKVYGYINDKEELISEVRAESPNDAIEAAKAGYKRNYYY